MTLEHTDSPLGVPPPHEPSSWNSRRPRRSWVIAALVILVVVIGVVWAIRHGTSPQVANAGRFTPTTALAVAVATATTGDIPVRIPALGAITPLATVTVRTQISGQLQQIAFKEGQMVHQGDFLAQIDPRPYQAALDQAQGNLRRDQALLDDAKLDLKRYQDLVAEDSIATQTLDTQKSLVQQHEGTVASDVGVVNTAKVNLQYTHIVSPVTGRVGLRQVDQGNNVTPSDPNGIVVVTQLQPISAVFAVPEDNIPAVMKRLKEDADPKVADPPDVTAFDRSNTAKLAEGKLLTADNQIDVTTGTVKLRALFDNKDGTLFPNQFVNILLLADVLRDQVIIPNAAVQHGAPNGVASTFVYLVNADSTVSVHPVTVGVADGERVAIVSGLWPVMWS